MSDDPRRDLPEPPSALFQAELLMLLEDVLCTLDAIAIASEEQAEFLRQLASEAQKEQAR
jgi:hypothetical protein